MECQKKVSKTRTRSLAFKFVELTKVSFPLQLYESVSRG